MVHEGGCAQGPDGGINYEDFGEKNGRDKLAIEATENLGGRLTRTGDDDDDNDARCGL